MSLSREVFVFRDYSKLADFALGKWREISADAVKARGRFTVALSGGKTPSVFYRRLADESRGSEAWTLTHIFLVDERFVPVDDADSNYRMIRETLLERAGMPPANVHPIPTNFADAAIAADLYGKEISSFFELSEGGLPDFDLIMLGIGEDGHTASLFPGTVSVTETKRLACPVILGAERHDRITLTLQVINNARNIIFMAAGETKAKVLRDVYEGKDGSLPASKVDPQNGGLLFLADAEAGRLLSEIKRH